MLAKIFSGAIVGLEAKNVTVEVDIASQGLPSFTIVGLPDKAIEESRERVRAAIKNSGADFPAKRITVNLAPADLPKVGPAYDLPIAIGILVASQQIIPTIPDALYMGELSLDGSLRHTNGILSLSLLARKLGAKHIFIPSVDAQEASIIAGIEIYPVASLVALFRHMTGHTYIPVQQHIPFAALECVRCDFDMADVQGQEHVKRALEIAAAGGHNLFMQGPPGAEKTMLARTLPSILPSLSEKEALEVTTIYSVTGNLPSETSLMRDRPFRSPHHTMSRVGLIGGGTHPMPGEISLAHRGVLFLDEIPEFPRHVLEALRQPMEDGYVHISRASGNVTYPAKFMLIGAANPCPCGNYGSDVKRCTCLPYAVTRYRKRISAPLLDRIDLHMYVPAVCIDKLTQAPVVHQAESSRVIQKRVQKARDFQLQRLSSLGLANNAEMSTKIVKEMCVLSPSVATFLKQAAIRLNLSARSYYRVLKVGRTIADISQEKDIQIMHIAEALQYRPVIE